MTASNRSDPTTGAAMSPDNGDAPPSADSPPVEPPPDGRFPRWIWGVYLVLFAASVPWYVPEDTRLRLWMGLPHWVVISLAASFAVAVFTAYVVHRLWPVQEPPD